MSESLEQMALRIRHIMMGDDSAPRGAPSIEWSNEYARRLLAEQKEQEPYLWEYRVNGKYFYTSVVLPPDDAYDEGTLIPLYAAPVAKAQDGMVMVPRLVSDNIHNAAVAWWHRATPQYTQELWNDLLDAAMLTKEKE